MTKRQTKLWLARIAGYHNDSEKFTRLLIEGVSINRRAMHRAFAQGAALAAFARANRETGAR